MSYKKIRNENEFLSFAMHQYSNPQMVSTDEFVKDIGRIGLIKKSIDRYLKDNNVNLRLLLNHFVILGNVFNKGIVPIILYKFKTESDDYKPVLKSIFIFLGWIGFEDMPSISTDPVLDNLLINLGKDE